jgi:predicted ATPase with chaperone activity
MTLESLDLAYLPALKYYEAPLHMKANGGTFLIDDFGRQRVEPHELLNRWIIPLEHQIDFLTLHTGQKIQVPFLLMLIIATNLDPKDVTDPAFLRRLGYRARLSAPTEELYAKIFQQYAARCGLTLERALIEHILARYRASQREMRACEPRDLIERVRDICNHSGQKLTIDTKLMDLAWEGYFGDAVS